MKVQDLKLICSLMSVNGLINEFKMRQDGNASAIDKSKTIVSELIYPNLGLSQDIEVGNLKGVTEILERFAGEETVEVKGNKLYIKRGERDYNFSMGIVTDGQINLPQLTEDDYEIVAKNIDHNILNELGKFRAQILVNELYHLYANDGKLMFRVGDEENSGSDKISNTDKATTNESMQFTMNVSETFKSIKTSANIKLAMKKLMLVECITDKYTVKYYLAPRVDA